MQDWNDLYFFAQVVANGGFAPAGRALRQPKSKLSRRVAQLEERLGVRLIERSSRRFQVTEIGRAFYERCRTVMAEVEAAEAVAAEARSEPRGILRFSCPTGLMEMVGPILPAFLTRYPKVDLITLATNRRVDIIDERIDVALRVRQTLDSDATLTLRTLGKSRRILVASPGMAAGLDQGGIEALKTVPTLSMGDEGGEVTWPLVGPEGASFELRHTPRFSCADFPAQRDAAAAGIGVALLPDHTCWEALRAGRLVRILPDWHAQEGIVHLVFTTRRGLPPAARALIDHLAENFRKREAEMRGQDPF
ncbi:LysR family transcriptional regulator [Lacibacterium aquatile]|uniref:LysR family transcriptional regulator n=1 Tax=Lacibacterium aquatile TaxID=1168082 RepID=A0ABW5DWU5_9PROT